VYGCQPRNTVVVNNCLKIVQRVLFPPVCLLCDAAAGHHDGPDGMDLCRACMADLPYLGQACTGCALPLSASAQGRLCGRCLQRRQAFAEVQAVFHYQTPVDGLIQGLKFNGRLNHARLLGLLMAQRFRLSGCQRPDILVPVPLHRRRLRERGFNQSLELARHMGRNLSLPVWAHACLRQRDTAAQSSLPARDRRHNVRNAFIGHASIDGLHVAVIDDVMTTGCTAHELALALLHAGARRVDVWVCARVVV